MSKSVLGRGLGTLLGGTKIPQGTDAPAPVAEGHGHSAIGSGLKTLLRPEGERKRTPFAEVDPNAGRTPWIGLGRVPSWYLFGADIGLLVLAGALVWLNSGGTARMTVAGCAVLLGALLSVMGVLCKAGMEPEPERRARWLVARSGQGEGGRDLVIRASDPVFVGEVRQSEDGRVKIVPLPAEGAPRISPTECEGLLTEAGEAYLKLAGLRVEESRPTER